MYIANALVAKCVVERTHTHVHINMSMPIHMSPHMSMNICDLKEKSINMSMHMSMHMPLHMCAGL